MKYSEWLRLKKGTVVIIESEILFQIEVKINKYETLIVQDLSFTSFYDDATGSSGIIRESEWDETTGRYISIASDWLQEIYKIN